MYKIVSLLASAVIGHHSPAGLEQSPSAHGCLRGHCWQLAAHVTLRSRARILKNRASATIALSRESPARRPTPIHSHRSSRISGRYGETGHGSKERRKLTSLSREHSLDNARANSSIHHLVPRTQLAYWPCAGADRRW